MLHSHPESLETRKHQQATARKLIVLIGCGAELYRKYLLEQINSAYDVWLFTLEEVTWQEPHLIGWNHLSDFSSQTTQDALANLLTHHSVSGIVSWDERYVIAAADLAVLAGLRTPGSIGIRGCRDKAFSRIRLREAGLQQPASTHAISLNEAFTFASSHPYPLVVKPRGMGGSIGVAMVTNDQELANRYQEACSAGLDGAAEFHHGALVEEFIDGSEISIDGSIQNGVYKPLFIARKSVTAPPHFEETGHVVSATDPLLFDEELLSVLQTAHRAIEFENGITHTEVKLSSRGPVIVEINGRLGGDLIPYLAYLATGLRPGLIAGQLAVGDHPSAECSSDRAAAIAFRYPDEDLVLSELKIPGPEKQVDYSEWCVPLAGAGTTLALPPSSYMARAAYAIAVGPDPFKCSAFSKSLANRIEIAGATLSTRTTGENYVP